MHARDTNTRNEKNEKYNNNATMYIATYLCRVILLARSDTDSRIRNRTSNQKRTGSISHASARSCANLAISKCERILREENPCVQQLAVCHLEFSG